ncbi:MAG: SDR family oxidoreductase [Burkholderiales bacterium]|nr:SDR family oxidoreductase [Burkholderiales bacterium]
MQMHGQRVLIVGVGGIGAPTAKICAQCGAEVLLADLRAPTAIASELKAKYQAQTSAYAVDIGSSDSIRTLCASAKNIDGLVITSGILPEETTLLPGTSEWEESFSRVFNINVRGPMMLAQLVLTEMISRSSGRIVIIGSIAGRNGGLLSGAQYAASKGALHAFVRWLALRAAPHGIPVNAVAPGATATPMLATRNVDIRKIPLGRLAEPIEIARVVALLASPAASYMHGAIVDVNGGAFFG